MAVEVEAVDRLRRGIEYVRSVAGITSAKLFEAILAGEEGSGSSGGSTRSTMTALTRSSSSACPGTHRYSAPSSLPGRPAV